MTNERMENLGKDIYDEFLLAFDKNVEWWGETNQLRAYLDVKKQVYYLVEKEGDSWKLEFWIDSYATDRINLQDCLQKAVVEHARYLHFLWHYNARGCRCRLQIRGVNDLVDDIKRLRGILREIEGVVQLSSCPKEDEKTSDVGLEVLTMADALGRKFTVPKYQRGYCWEEEHVVGLLEDVKTWMATHGNDTQYRIGTVVLKKTKKEAMDVYEIIDGQQRLTTLFLYDAVMRTDTALGAAIEANQDSIDRHFELGQNNAKQSAVKRLRAAAECIKKWRAGNITIGANIDPIDFKRISIAAVIIPDCKDDLAFEFFNHLNSSGKPLSDYDLLKSHHLRYIEGGALSKRMADMWNGIDHEVHIPIESGQGEVGEKLVTKRNLLHESLYRIRMWLRGQDFKYYADEMPSHELFSEFTMDYVPIKDLFTARKESDVDSLVPDGFEFFEYVEKYKKLYDLFVAQKSVIALEKNLAWHSHGTLFQAIHALTFFYFCKFGDVYLNEAAYAIAYRVSELRNEAQIRRQRISDQMFGKIANLIRMATHEGELLGKLLDPKCVYRVTNYNTTAEWFWKSLGAFGEEVSQNSDILNRYNYIRGINQVKDQN